MKGIRVRYVFTSPPGGRGELAGDSTRSVHEAEPIDELTGSLTTPIYETSTFGFKRAEEVPRVVGGGRGYVYSRWDNPTVVRLEEKLAAFERGEDAAAFSSGMAAISTAIFGFVKKGAHVLGVRDLYGGTYAMLHDILPDLGLSTDLVETTDFGPLERGVMKSP